MTPPVEVGTELPPLTLRFTRETLVRYAGASGDFNPIHWSDRAAFALGLGSVIAHGMLTMGAAARVVTDWVGDPARLRSWSARFPKPVPVPGDDEGVLVEVTARVTAVEGGIATVAVDATCDGVKVLGAARAEVIVD